jgi:V/A-type H+-transporting ATPase subunit I
MSSGVSFIRLAAFGMMHAALSLVIWNATVALVQHPWGWPAAIVVFIVGTALAIALEALVAAIQALGRVFTPFRIELVKDKELI